MNIGVNRIEACRQARARAVELYQQGDLSSSQIAARLGVSADQVRRWTRAAGIDGMAARIAREREGGRSDYA